MSLVLHSIEEVVRSRCGGGRAPQAIEISPEMLAEAREKALGEADRVFVLPEDERVPTEALAAVIRDAGLPELAAYVRETADYRRGGERMASVLSVTAEETVLFLLIAASNEARMTGGVRTLRSSGWLLRCVGAWSYKASLRNPKSRMVKLAEWLYDLSRGLRVGVVMLPYRLKGWRRMPTRPSGPGPQTGGEAADGPPSGAV
jgi:hypothetical protein